MAWFWASSLSESNTVVVEIPDKHVLTVTNATRAVMDPSDGALSVGLETQQLDGSLWKGFVCHFDDGVHQHKLDLVFTKKVKFYIANGCGRINLTGYFQAAPPATLTDVKKTTTLEPAEVPHKESNNKKQQPNKSVNAASPAKVPAKISSDVQESVKKNAQPPKASVQTPKANVQPPKPNVQTAKASVQTPKVNVQSSKANVQPSKKSVQAPKENGQLPKASGQQSEVSQSIKTPEKSASTPKTPAKAMGTSVVVPEEAPKAMSKAARKRARKEEAAKAALATKEVTWDQVSDQCSNSHL